METKIAVIGAGQIGSRLVRRLAKEGHLVTWLSRSAPNEIPEGISFKAVDVCDGEALTTALGDAAVMIIAVNPSTYDAKVWAATLPPMHRGLIAAAQKTGARVVLLEGLYQYALDAGPLSPNTPHRPTSEKGRIRQTLARMWGTSGVRLTTLCASDFWGPGLSAALLTTNGLEGLKRGKAVLVVGDPDVPHAFSHVNDIVDGLVNLALATDVAGHTFHAPVTHMTQRALVEAAARAVRVKGKIKQTPRWLLRVAGLFDKSTGGIVEMLPQWTHPYLVDDSSYRRRFNAAARTDW